MPKVTKQVFHKESANTSTDPNAVPAFDTALGVKRTGHSTEKPVLVNPVALEHFNAGVSDAALKYQMDVANIAALFAKKAIRPDEIAALRRRMFDVVSNGLLDVEQVIKGNKVWNNTQVRLFSLLTERVMPKLSSITVSDATPKRMEDLSMEELEAIALGRSKASAIDAIDKQAQQLDAQALEEERAETRKTVRKLGVVAALDEGEKVYTKKKRGAEEEAAKKSSSAKSRSRTTDAPTSPKASDQDAPAETSGESKE